MLDSIHYYPLINGDTDGIEKFPLFHTTDEDYIRSSHDYYLEEVVSKYYRICVGRGGDPDKTRAFTIRCPTCGQVMRKVSLGSNKNQLALYTCQNCNH